MNEIEKAIEQLDMQIKCTVNTVSIKSCNLAISALTEKLNGGWVKCEDGLPEENINQVIRDFKMYNVTVKFEHAICTRTYTYGYGKWWNEGTDMTRYVIAWQPLPSPYQPTDTVNHIQV